MRRHLFTIASVLSLLLCGATLAMWIRSRSVCDSFDWRIDDGRGVAAVSSANSAFHFNTMHIPYIRMSFEEPGFHSQRDKIILAASPTPILPGIRAWQKVKPYAFGTQIWVPDWIPAILFLLLPAVWMVRRYQNSRPKPGECRGCTYDLTGNTSGVCPECGTAIPVAAIVPMKGVDAETLSLSTNAKFLGILRKSFAQLDSGRTVSLAEMKRRVKAK